MFILNPKQDSAQSFNNPDVIRDYYGSEHFLDGP